MEKFIISPAFSSSLSTTSSDNIDSTGAENSFNSARTMTITDGKFFKIVPGKCNYNTTVATCVKCEPKLVRIKGTLNSSSNFICHLKRKHGYESVQEYTEYLHSKKRYKRLASDTPSRQLRSKATTTTTTTSQEVLEGKILKFIIDSMVPLKTVVSPSFLALFQHSNIPQSDLKVINCQNLSLKIKQLFHKNSEQLRNKLRTVSNVFTTANIWSGEDRRFLFTTAHWIDAEMKRQSAALRFQRLSRTCCSEKVASMLNEVQSEFGLQHTTVTKVTGDYSCNLLKGFNDYGIESSSIDSPFGNELNCDEDVNDFNLDNDILETIPTDHLKCPVQTLILCASVEIAKFISNSRNLSNLHVRVMKKCNILWSHSESMDILKEITGLTVNRPCSNNWTSIYTSLREILTIKDKSVEIFQALEIKDCLQESEFLYIEEHLMCTKPLADALAILQDSEYTLCGSLLPTLLALRRQLNKLLDKEWVYCRPLALENIRIVNEKFQDFYNFNTTESTNACIAAFSHPEFKNRWLSCVESKYQAKILLAFKESVAAELPATQSSDTMTKVHTPSRHKFFDFGTENEVIETSTAVAEMRVLQYFHCTNRSLSGLQNFPEIQKVFLKYNTPLSSFAPVEQMLGYDTLSEVLISDKPMEKNIEMRVLLKANINMLQLD